MFFPDNPKKLFFEFPTFISLTLSPVILYAAHCAGKGRPADEQFFSGVTIMSSKPKSKPANAYEKRSFDAGKELADALADNVNSLGNGVWFHKGVEDGVRRTHRTLQQSVMREVIVPYLKALADQGENGFTDARNADSCRVAKKMLDAAGDDYLPFV
jgi:hypothetical protein